MPRVPRSRVPRSHPATPGERDGASAPRPEVPSLAARGARIPRDERPGLRLLYGALLLGAMATGVLLVGGVARDLDEGTDARPFGLAQADPGVEQLSPVAVPAGTAPDTEMGTTMVEPPDTRDLPSQPVVLSGWQDWDWTGATSSDIPGGDPGSGFEGTPEDPLATQLELLYVLIDPLDPRASHIRVRYRESLEDYGTQVLFIGDHLPPPWDAAELRHVREDAIVFVFDESAWSARIPEVLTASGEGVRALGAGHGAEGGRRLRPRRAPGLSAGIPTAAPRPDGSPSADDPDPDGFGAGSGPAPGSEPGEAGDPESLSGDAPSARPRPETDGS